MRQNRYLNVILTINALLLVVVLWSMVAGVPLGPSAQAQSRGSAIRPGLPTLPNSAAQRDQMITALQAVKSSMDQQTQLMQSGRLRVEVTNLESIRINHE